MREGFCKQEVHAAQLTFNSNVLSATLNPPGTGGLSRRVSLMTQPVYFSCSKTSISSVLLSWFGLHNNP